MLYVYFTGKRGTLDIVSAAVIGGRSQSWLAWRMAMGGDNFSYFHFGLVDGEVLAG